MTISIVTLSYNQARFLPDAIESIQGQVGVDVEHIIVDPGSSDGSREVAESLASDATVLIFEPDSGPSDGLNKGFDRATGDIFGFINADDRLEPGALAYVERWFGQHPDFDVLTGAMRIINEDGSTRWRLRNPVPFSVDLHTAGLTTVVQQSTFIRRDAFEHTGGFEEQNTTNWDLELFIDLALSGAQFAMTTRVLAGFRHHDAAITQRVNNPTTESDHRLADRSASDEERILDKIAETGTPIRAPADPLRSMQFKLRPWRRVLETTHLGHYKAGWTR